MTVIGCGQNIGGFKDLFWTPRSLIRKARQFKVNLTRFDLNFEKLKIKMILENLAGSFVSEKIFLTISLLLAINFSNLKFTTKMIIGNEIQNCQVIFLRNYPILRNL